MKRAIPTGDDGLLFPLFPFPLFARVQYILIYSSYFVGNVLLRGISPLGWFGISSPLAYKWDCSIRWIPKTGNLLFVSHRVARRVLYNDPALDHCWLAAFLPTSHQIGIENRKGP